MVVTKASHNEASGTAGGAMARRGPALIPRRPSGDAAGSTPAPGELEKVRAFVNTRDIEERTDELTSPAALAAWLGQQRLASRGRISQADLALAIELREALRGVLRSHVSPGSHPAGTVKAGGLVAGADAAGTGLAGADAAAMAGAGADVAGADAAGADADAARLSRIAAGLPAQLRVTADGRPELAAGDAAGTGRAALARILIIAAEAATLGTWDRLKVCSASDCQWAFYDRSPTRSGCWCSMRICGARAKSRSYRQRTSSPPGRAKRTPAGPRPRSSQSARSAAPGA
jgi:CGNR zinc finger/Putative stress-induced transcription regulator